MKIIVIQKGNAIRVYLGNIKDWLSPDKFIINAQIPFIGAKDFIRKENYELKGGE